jgi:hypothetical protein
MRGLLNLLVGIAFVVCSLLPVGFMLAVPPAPDAAVEIVICLGQGPQSLTLDDQGSAAGKSAHVGQKYLPLRGSRCRRPRLLAHVVRYAAVSYRITAEIFQATPKPGAQSARGPPTTPI